jgi:hypothetical protein
MIRTYRRIGFLPVPRSAFRVPSFALVLVLLPSAARAVSLEADKARTLEAEGAMPAPPKGDPAPLIPKLGDAGWQVREKAMRDLIEIGPNARNPLRVALTSSDPEVRWRAQYALSQIDIGFDLVTTDPGRRLYASAAESRAKKGGEAAARLLYQEVAEKFPDTRWAAAARERLGGARPEARPPETPKAGEAAIAGLIAKLGSAAWAERQGASVRLAALGVAARQPLEGAAKSPDSEVAWRARRLLDRLPQDEAVAPRPADQKNPRVRIEIAEPDQDPEHPGASAANLDRLVKTLASDEPTEVAGAREVLQNLGPSVIGPLVRALDAANEVTGVEIMDILQKITRQGLGFDPERWRAWWKARRQKE